MPSGSLPNRPVRVLHVSTDPLPRVVREGLRAIGLEVEVLTPDDIDDVLMPTMNAEIERPITPEQRQAMRRRLANADMCVLGEGAGPRLAALILGLRQFSGMPSMTTVEMVHDIGWGLLMKNELLAPPHDFCDLIHDRDLLERLRRLGSPGAVGVQPVSAVMAATRPPRPLLYALHPQTYSPEDLAKEPKGVPVDMHRANGTRRLQELLAPASAGTWTAIDAHEALAMFVRNLPSEDLYLLGTPEAGWWWRRLLEQAEAADPPPQEDWLAEWSPEREAVSVIMWQALTRDGGRETLSSLPDALLPLRAEVEALWPSWVEYLAERMPLKFVSAEANGRYEESAVRVLEHWSVVPSGDPLAAGADPHLYRPTIATLRAARQYRSAPDVILEARGRWGGRPYLEKAAAEQLAGFVGESYPSSEEELDEWIRLLRTLPAGRLRKMVCEGVNRWPRIEIPLAEAWPAGEEIQPEGTRVPILDRNGKVIALIGGERQQNESIRRLTCLLKEQGVLTEQGERVRRTEPDGAPQSAAVLGR